MEDLYLGEYEGLFNITEGNEYMFTSFVKSEEPISFYFLKYQFPTEEQKMEQKKTPQIKRENATWLHSGGPFNRPGPNHDQSWATL